MTMSATISEEDKNTLNDIAYRAVQIKKSLSLGTTVLTPLNYDEERDKFFSSRTYNPQFIYAEHNNHLYREELNALLTQADLLSVPQDLKFYIQDFLINLHFLNITYRSIGTRMFPQACHALFDWNIIDPDPLKQMFQNYPFNETHDTKLFDSNMIKESLEDTLQRTYDIDTYKVTVDTFAHNIIRAGNKKISIGSRIKRSRGNVQRLIVHEIESHVLQTLNIKESNNPLLEISKYNDTNLYSEGLAVYNEVMTQTLTKTSLETYYYRLKAVSMLQQSFREIYTFLSKSLPSEKAYLITYRVKRGMGDTSLPGGFPKDAAYFQGFKEVYEYLKRHGRLYDMYFTKTPELTTLLRTYGLLPKKPKYLPHFVMQDTKPSQQNPLIH